jgi:membrane protease YdiL (CAAX protease family)
VFVVALWQSGLVVTFRLIPYPAETFSAGYDLAAFPRWLAWSYILMSSLVAGICEETGYRGYAQVPLEARYGPRSAIAIVSVMFLLVHLPQAWAPPVLVHLFVLSVLLGALAYSSGSLIPSMLAHTGLDIFNFSYWWTDIAGRFDRRPISETGIDAHFVVWALVFLVSALLFAWALRKSLAAGQPG